MPNFLCIYRMVQTRKKVSTLAEQTAVINKALAASNVVVAAEVYDTLEVIGQVDMEGAKEKKRKA